MKHFPAFFALESRRCVLIGGGEAAARKAALLHRAGAAVTVVAPSLDHELAELAAAGDVDHRARDFEPDDLDGATLVVSATEDLARDEIVAVAARARNIPVNVVDRPALSDFIVPAIVDRDPVTVAISTAGTAPVLARSLRAQIEAMLPAGLGRLARFADAFRGAVKGKIADGTARRRLWERVFDGPVSEAVLRGDEPAAREAMLRLINTPASDEDREGIVHIVGAGPGDPDLLTFRALRVMQQADVVIHDKLVAPEILDYVRRDAERIYVGKSRGRHSRSQDEINRLMAEQARAGRRVVRLKGGDPFVFGRGGEELDYLKERGVRAEVVPGITAATGCAAAAGIPLTHRDHASAVTFVTGHGRDGEPDLDWAALATGRQTLVIYMGVATAASIAARLVDHGLNPGTPAAIVEKGTRPDQKVVAGSVADLGAMVVDHAIEGPALLVIGDVVGVVQSSGAVPVGLPVEPVAAAGGR